MVINRNMSCMSVIFSFTCALHSPVIYFFFGPQHVKTHAQHKTKFCKMLTIPPFHTFCQKCEINPLWECLHFHFRNKKKSKILVHLDKLE